VIELDSQPDETARRRPSARLPRYRDLRLRTKFAIQVTGCIVVLFTALVPAVDWLQTHIVLDDARHYGLQLTKSFAHSSVQAVAVDDFLVMRHIINSVASESEILYAMIMDPAGRLLAHSDLRLVGRTLADPVSLRAAGAERSLIQDIRHGRVTALDVAVPIYVLTERRAIARIGMSLERELAGIRRTRNLIILAGILTLCAGVVLASVQARAIARPIRDLVLGSREIARGRLHRQIPVTSSDEVGILASAFNSMAESLRVRFDVDRELSSTLNPHVVLQTLVRHAAKLSRADVAFLATRESETAEAVVVACEGARSSELSTWSIAPGLGLLGARLTQGSATRLEAPFANCSAKEAQVLSEEAIRHLALLPVSVQGRTVGLLGVGRRTGDAFEGDAEEVLRRLADQAAVALANALAYREVVTLNLSLEAKVAERTKALMDANEELEASQEKLRELDRLKSEFVSNVSHELRTPLATIRMAVDNLLDGVAGGTNPVITRYLTRVKDSADRLVRLITDLLDLSRIEAGRVELRLGRVAVGEVLQDVLETIDPAAGEKGLTLSVTTPFPDDRAWADRDKLQQILINLLGNAVKFTPSGGRIAVSGRLAAEIGPPGEGHPTPSGQAVEPRYIEVAVEDTGPGIPLEERTAIFEKFHQVRRGGQGKAPGTGLGLAITKSLIEMHGGRIWVTDGSPGSRFVFTMPLAQSRGIGGDG
jgi:signal transduction histidine kinase